MINTNKRIHIYNRYRTIYTSKNNYYIRHNKKYIDLYTILKKISAKDGIKRGGGAKDKNNFLTDELRDIKDSIVIFKLLMDDKQSEAINLYINLIELINTKKDLIIKKINTYPQNYFDNELNKSSIITYVKNMLYKNIFNNYLINIIPRIDINSFIKDNDKNAIENIIKSLLHLNDDSDEKILKKINDDIQKYNDVLESTIKTNCSNYDILKDIIVTYISNANSKVKDAINEVDDEEEVVDEKGKDEVDEEEEGEDEGEDEDDEGGEEGDEGEEDGDEGGEAGDEGGEEGRKTKKKKKVKNKKTSNKDDVKKAIDEDMAVIKEDLENLENKDYVDRLLLVLEKESEYYEMFISSTDKVFDNSELRNYFNNIKKFLDDYKALYKEYIEDMKIKLEKNKTDMERQNNELKLNETSIKEYELEIKKLKEQLKNEHKKYEEIRKKIEELEKNADADTDADTDVGANPVTNEGTDPGNPQNPVSGGYKRRSKGNSKRISKGISKRYKIYHNIIRKGGEGGEGGDGGEGGEGGDGGDGGEGGDGGDGGEGGEGGEENIVAEKKEEEKLKIQIKKLKQQYADEIIKIRDLKLKINELKKGIEKIKKKIETIQKKIKQYEEFLEKIEVFFTKIKNNLDKVSINSTSNKEEQEKYTNISLYKKYIETIIFNIKTKILYYFIANYIKFCNEFNNIRDDSIGDDNYGKLKDLIETLYTEEKDATKFDDNVSDTADPGTPDGTPDAKPPVAPVAPGAPVAPVASGGGFKGGKGQLSVCAYLTDVEGNLDFFEKYVRISKVIEWTDSKKNRLRFKQKDSMFVFGGDCQDRGIGDIRFVNLLLNFKEEYPDRVEFIIGNRDANKIRIYSELSEKIVGMNKTESVAENKYLAKYDNFPYWVNKNERITLRKYLKDNNYKIDNVSRLKYILDYTMGSNDAFDKRRKELSIILNKNPNLISDNDIVTSFLNSISPNPKNIKDTNDNYMLKYLKSGKIAYIFGEHIFVHGAINKYSIGYIPNNKNMVNDVDKWVSGLNKWFQKDLKEYMANPEYGGISKKRKGYKIIDYVVPSDNKSVVYSDNLKNGNGQYINTKVIKYLNKGGIHSIISGHRPHGDCPLVLRSKKLTAVSADTSYSKKGHVSKWGIDNRGNAVSEVLLYLNGDIQIHGRLQDNQKYDYIIKNKESKPEKQAKPIPKYDKYIGLQLKNKYWVKNVIYDKSAKNAKYYISYAKGFEYDDKWITETELLKLL